MKNTKYKTNQIKSRLLTKYGGIKSELRYSGLYELIVAVILSAQCTDKRVNIITKDFFVLYPDIKTLASANIDDIKESIKTCSYYNNKAKNIHKMANQVLKDFGGQIPLDEKDLMSLAGVGQKTAHVVMIEYLGANTMAVDTHVFRTSHRLGLSNTNTPTKCEVELCELFKTDLGELHQAMVLFGRYVCKAKNPTCSECIVSEFCVSKDNFKPR